MDRRSLLAAAAISAAGTAVPKAGRAADGLPTTYIICADPIYKPLEASRNWVKAAGWKTVEIQCGHDAMVIAPDRLADLLDADAA